MELYRRGVVERAAVVVGGGAAELGLRLGLRLVLCLGEVVVAAEAGAGELLLVLLAHLADLGEVHGVVRQRAVLHVPVPERRHRHPAVAARRVLPPLLRAPTKNASGEKEESMDRTQASEGQPIKLPEKQPGRICLFTGQRKYCERNNRETGIAVTSFRFSMDEDDLPLSVSLTCSCLPWPLSSPVNEAVDRGGANSAVTQQQCWTCLLREAHSDLLGRGEEGEDELASWALYRLPRQKRKKEKEMLTQLVPS